MPNLASSFRQQYYCRDYVYYELRRDLRVVLKYACYSSTHSPSRQTTAERNVLFNMCSQCKQHNTIVIITRLKLNFRKYPAIQTNHITSQSTTL